MPKKETKTESKGYAEFKYSGNTFDYSGRIYPKMKGSDKGKVKGKYYVALCFNDVFTLKGCYLVETESDYFLTFPQFAKKDGDKTAYDSFVFVDKKLNDEIDELTNFIYKASAAVRGGANA